jgi:Recombinase
MAPAEGFLLQRYGGCGTISVRTKVALAANKARGTKLGDFRGRAGTAEDTARNRAARTQKATEARSIAPIIDRVDPDRTASLRGIARALNGEGIPTPSGEGTWTAATVARLRQRLELS